MSHPPGDGLQEADEAFGAVHAALLEQLPSLDYAEPGAGQAWSDNLAETRASFMETVSESRRCLSEAKTLWGRM